MLNKISQTQKVKGCIFQLHMEATEEKGKTKKIWGVVL